MSSDRDDVREKMRIEAEKNGYHLCPDADLLDDLIDGLVTNEGRYGYGSCPCRISSGVRTYDSDIICPCEYRDADVEEFGMCYCCLFVSDEVKENPSRMGTIPERRQDAVMDASLEARDRLERGEIEPIEVSCYGYQQRKYIPLRHPDLSVLNAREIHLIDDVIDRLSDMTAKQISEYSHQDIPWITAEDGERIEYESVFYRTPQYSVRGYEEEEGDPDAVS